MILIKGVVPPASQGPLTYNGVVVRHPDGSPVMAGDLVAGSEYYIDPETCKLVNPHAR